MAKRLQFWFNRVRQERLFQGILVVGVLGVLLVNLPPFAFLSYDLSFLARPSSSVTNIAVVYVNEDTLRTLGDDHGELPRTRHAQLLDRLGEDGAKLVFYDFVFDLPDANPENDQTLKSAIERQGSVILAAAGEQTGAEESLSPPVPALRDAAKGWGHAVLDGDIVRTISGDFAGQKYAVWVAATNARPQLGIHQDRNRMRWMNYYGSDSEGALPWCYFHDALSNNDIPPGFFAQKTVFVGLRLATEKPGNAPDNFATPYSRWGWPGKPGVVIHATAFLNLLQDDWLRLMPRGWECLLAGIWGAAVTAVYFAASRKHLPAKLGVALVSITLICVVSLYVQWHFHLWCVWVVPAFAQPVAAFAWVALHPKPDPYLAFVSYRTTEDGATARLIADHLLGRGCRTFLDVKSLEAGKFDEQLLGAIDSAKFYVLILSSTSLARCVEPDDWVLKELAYALAKRKHIVPVFKDDFDFNDKKNVPDLPEIGKLRSCHGLKCSIREFDVFMKGLARLLGVR